LRLEKRYLNELEVADEFLKVARNNLNLSLKTSANRLYFSFEKAVIAYLMFKEVKVPKNHQKIWELCAKFLGEFFYDHLRHLYDLRMQADYGNISVFVIFNKKIVEGEIMKSEVLIKQIKVLLK